jgi:hypothetical protein
MSELNHGNLRLQTRADINDPNLEQSIEVYVHSSDSSCTSSNLWLSYFSGMVMTAIDIDWISLKYTLL